MKINLFNDGTANFADSSETLLKEFLEIEAPQAEQGELYLNGKAHKAECGRWKISSQEVPQGVSALLIVANGKKYYCESLCRKQDIVYPTGTDLRIILRNKARLDAVEKENADLKQRMDELEHIFLGVKII